jgi:ethanolamine transporter EutH
MLFFLVALFVVTVVVAVPLYPLGVQVVYGYSVFGEVMFLSVSYRLPTDAIFSMVGSKQGTGEDRRKDI